MIFSLPEISGLLTVYGYYILFPIVVVEGPIITVMAGFFVSLNQLNLILTYIVVVLGDLTGDCIYYFVGRLGKGSIIKRRGSKFPLSVDRISNLENIFHSNGGKTLLLGKISHGIGAAFLVAAGMAKMPFRKFLWYNLLGTLLKSIILILIGFYYGQAIIKINTLLELIGAAALTIGIIFLIFYFYHPRKK